MFDGGLATYPFTSKKAFRSSGVDGDGMSKEHCRVFHMPLIMGTFMSSLAVFEAAKEWGA
jgi:hypothetical protein